MDQEAYYLELIEQKNHTNNGLPSLNIITHYDIFKMLPLNKHDMDFIEDAKYEIGDEKYTTPYKLFDHSRLKSKRQCYYMGYHCFEFCNIKYFTRTQIGHRLLQYPNVKLIHSNATSTSKPENAFSEISIYDKWLIPKQTKISF